MTIGERGEREKRRRGLEKDGKESEREPSQEEKKINEKRKKISAKKLSPCLSFPRPRFHLDFFIFFSAYKLSGESASLYE